MNTKYKLSSKNKIILYNLLHNYIEKDNIEYTVCLESDLHLDSLDLLAISDLINAEFNISITDEEIIACDRIGDIINLTAEKLACIN